MNRLFRFLKFCCVVSAALTFLQIATAAESAANSNSFSGSLELLDGSVLHGQLRGIDSQNGLAWRQADAKQLLQFKPDNLGAIHFSEVEKNGVGETTCQFRFSNGDQFFGNLLSLSETEMELQTWFGGKFKTPRNAVRSIHFYAKGSGTIYEGPTGLEGWQLGKNSSPHSWQYRDGALVSNSPNTIGRDVHLPDSSRVEFDIGWGAPFNLLFSFYTSALDGFNYNSSSYMFFISPGSVSLQRISTGAGSSTLGRAELILPMTTRKKAHLEFHASKTENLIEMLVDGQLAGQWKDSAGWVAKGTGILFFTQTEGAALTISNIKVSEWDGRLATGMTTNSNPAEDEVFLANRDKVTGKIVSLKDGKFSIVSSAGKLEIPMQRVTEVAFSAPTAATTARNPWEIQVSVFGGGAISFTLEKWSAEKLSGHNANFGDVSLNSSSIREIKFNPAKSRPGENNVDDILWEADEH